MEMMLLLTKKRKKYLSFKSTSHQLNKSKIFSRNLYYNYKKNVFIPYCTLILLLIIENIFTVNCIAAIKYNDTELYQKLSQQQQQEQQQLSFIDSNDEILIHSNENSNENNEKHSILNFNENNNNKNDNKSSKGSIKISSLNNDEYFDQLTINNPCLVHYCQKGRECILDQNTNQPICICQRHCSQRKRLICGSNGQIYKNHCKLHQASCQLDIPITYQRLEKCLKKSTKISKTLHPKTISIINKNNNNNNNKFKKYYKQLSTKLPSLSHNYNIDYENNNNDDIDENNNDNNEKEIFKNHKNLIHKDLIIEKQQEQQQKKISKINENNNNNNNGDGDGDADDSDNDANENTLMTKKFTNNNNKQINEQHIIINNNNNNYNDNDHKINLNITLKKINKNNLIETSILEQKKMCTSQEYEIMKDNLLLFNHARLMSQDNNHSKDFLVSIMFSHYDQNNDAYLEIEELNQISFDEHLEELSNGCVLEDMLNFDDLNGDEKLSINEFYQAFSKLYSVSVVSLDKALETNHLSARVGDNVEIKCDVTGSPSPPIIWRRDDVDLSTLNIDDIRVFSDGSLYLTRIQLLHSGNYTCHAQRNKDVVQTHILNVYTIPQVLVMPRIQSKRPGENAEMWCHVTGDPLPKVEWLKNDEKLNLNIPDKYEIIGNGTALRMHNIQYSDTGAYMCQATNIGGTVRDISSLIVQEEPTPTVLNEERKFFVFHEFGISIYEPSTCRLYHQIQSTDIIPGTQEYVCGNKGVKCSWGRAITAGTRYIYATQPTLDRVLVISTIQMVVVDVIQTDKYPVELYYVQKFDQIWILNWRYEKNIDSKTIQVIREAGQKRKHHTVHPEPIDGQFDLVRDLFIPSSDLEQPHFSYNYGYVTHKNQRGLYKLDLANLRYTKSVDLTLHNCVPENIVFSALYGFVILSCREPITNRPQGQLVLDYLTDAILTTKPSLYGIPKISPDSRHLVTIQHNLNEVVIVVQKITRNGLEFLFDVKTTLNISDVTFYESQTMHGYDLFASANDKENILYLNLYTGKVEMITGVGLPIPMTSIQWGNPGRVIRSSGLFGLYMLTTANNALFVINGRARTVNCEIGGVEHPTSIVWTHSLQNYATNQQTPYINEL